MRVHDDSPLKNSAGAADPAMVIKGGDAVGFCFESPDKQQQRIIAAQVDGQPMVVCYRPVSPRKKPYTFASPVSTYVMDYVAPLPAARAVFTPIEGGYAVGIALPWDALGLTPREGLEFPFDAQVIFSDPAGTKNIATAWWHSRGNGPACTVDLPTEAPLSGPVGDRSIVQRRSRPAAGDRVGVGQPGDRSGGPPAGTHRLHLAARARSAW